jgi:hypothetical protein
MIAPNARRLVSLGLLLALSACAAPVPRGAPSAPPAAAHPEPSPPPAPRPAAPAAPRPDPSALTSEEMGRLQELLAAAERVRVVYGPPCAGSRCAPAVVIVEGLEPVAVWDPARFRIGLQRRALAPGVEPRPALAHELAHWLLGHTEASCGARATECEGAANAEAVQILTVGWGLTHENAVSLMYASLSGALHRSQPMRGHDTACRELAEFASTFGRPSPSCPER